MAMGGMGWHMRRSYSSDESVTKQRLAPGTLHRIAGYARPYLGTLSMFLAVIVVDALITVVNPLLLKAIIDRGILPHDVRLIVTLAVAAAVVALLGAGLGLLRRWISSRLGERLIYDLRSQVFDHVQRMPIAFFTRAQTGSLVTRLNGDVVGAQQALTTTLSSVVSSVLTLAGVLIAMFLLSWQITVVALVLLPLFVLPAKYVGRRMQRLTRERMQLDAEMGSMMTERFNVAGAMLAKLYGRPEEESVAFDRRAAGVRDLGVSVAVYGQVFITGLTLVAALATAAVYGIGGVLTVHGAFQIGTLVALTGLLARLYGPLTSLSNVQVNVMTALVSFDRVFEVLDLEPMVADAPDAGTLPAGPARLELDDVSFTYPAAADVSLASLESIARPDTGAPAHEVLHGVSLRAEPGAMVALVGPSGAGKTTITHLAARLYDPDSGAVRINGTDLRSVTQRSLHDVIGVVTQEAHMFHDSIRANLSYAKPEAGDDELWEALRAAQVAELVASLPDGLDTVLGDRGYRLSGGEKARLAIARLLLKAPDVVVLDEATAHLDSESEAAVQRALATALTGRTSLVIAHRLSTILDADEIVVVDGGRVVERGTHRDLLAAGGLYAELYRTQFERQRPAAVAD